MLVPTGPLAEAAQKRVESAVTYRPLQMVLLFGGQGEAAEVHRSKGLGAESFDKANGKHEDITCIYGCVLATWLVYSLCPGGTAWMSPCCSSWLSFVSRHTFKRSPHGDDIFGDLSSSQVLEANACVQIMARLMFICAFRLVHVAVENPLASLIFHEPSVRAVSMMIGMERIVSCQGAFGAPSEKPLEIHSDVPNLSAWVARSKRDAREAFKGSDKEPIKLYKKGKWVDGRKADMKESSAYPLQMCQSMSGAIAAAVEKRKGVGSDAR
jgi:hypothetical protein